MMCIYCFDFSHDFKISICCSWSRIHVRSKSCSKFSKEIRLIAGCVMKLCSFYVSSGNIPFRRRFSHCRQVGTHIFYFVLDLSAVNCARRPCRKKSFSCVNVIRMVSIPFREWRKNLENYRSPRRISLLKTYAE